MSSLFQFKIFFFQLSIMSLRTGRLWWGVEEEKKTAKDKPIPFMLFILNQALPNRSACLPRASLNLFPASKATRWTSSWGTTSSSWRAGLPATYCARCAAACIANPHHWTGPGISSVNMALGNTSGFPAPRRRLGWRGSRRTAPHWMKG